MSKDVYRYAERNLTKERLWIGPTEYPYHFAGRVDRAVWENSTHVKISTYDMAKNLVRNCKKTNQGGRKMHLLALAAIAMLAVCFRSSRTKRMPSTTVALLLVPAAGAISAYMCIEYFPRYVNPWLIWAALVVIAGAWSTERLPRCWSLLRGAGMVLLISASVLFVRDSILGYRRAFALIPKHFRQFEVARRVCQLDVRDICVISPVGSRYPTSSVLWIRHTPCRIRACYPDGQRFYSLNSSELEEVLARLAKEDINAVLLQSPPQVHPNWTNLGEGYYIVDLADYQ